jgi:HEAT repeat protein
VSEAHDRSGVRARAGAADDEIRYRAAAELEPVDADDRAVLFGLLPDRSWRVRSAALERLAAASDPGAVLPGLLAALSGGPNAGARDAAAAALSRIGAPAVAPLLARLDGDDPDMRQAAAGVLGAIADRRAVAPLAARLADPDPNVRAAAAEALGKIGGPEAVATLLAALDSDDATLRLSALESLGALRACPPAAQVAALLRDRAMRRPAYRGLGASDEPETAVLLAGGLLDGSRGVREAALAGIGQQRARRTAAELDGLAAAVRAVASEGPVAESSAQALGSEDLFVAIGALAVLGWLGATDHLGAVLRRAEDERLRPFVEEALDSLPKGSALRAALAAALEVQGPFGRIAALGLLARLGSPAALESVVREASDPDGYLQGEAIAALGGLGDPRAVEPLVGLLGDDAPAVSGVAATALVRLGHDCPAAANAAVAALRHRAGASPSAALYRVLGALGVAEDLPWLRAGLRRISVVQRIAAAGAISSMFQRGVVLGDHLPELIGALTDPAWPVRAAAARAFLELARTGAAGRGGDPRPRATPLRSDALAALEASLSDGEPAVRAAAMEALGACGRVECAPHIAGLARAPGAPPAVIVAALRALEALRRLPEDVIGLAARHDDPEVVKEAIEAAAGLPGAEAERILRDGAQSPRWDVRQAAARAMAQRGDPALREAAAAFAARETDPLVARAFAAAEQALACR